MALPSFLLLLDLNVARETQCQYVPFVREATDAAPEVGRIHNHKMDRSQMEQENFPPESR